MCGYLASGRQVETQEPGYNPQLAWHYHTRRTSILDLLPCHVFPIFNELRVYNRILLRVYQSLACYRRSSCSVKARFEIGAVVAESGRPLAWIYF